MSKITAHGIKTRKPFAYKSAYLVKLRDTHYDELYLGTRNYRIITRYNASARYAVTIALYAEAMEREWRRVK
jgi:membrane-bound lytic murein transglycosylase B